MGIDIDPRTEHTLEVLRDIIWCVKVVPNDTLMPRVELTEDEYAALLDAIQLIEGEQV